MPRSFDDLGTPLHQVTFVVLDLETTGGSPAQCGITEVGAVKVRGGEVLGTFQTLVNPGVPIPPSVTFLTGLTDAMVLPAPPIEAVLPSFLEFLNGAIVVGHNVRFDLGFLNAALAACGRGRLPARAVDTCALARRLVRDEVPNCKLATLARYFRVSTPPTHRALDDARATVEVFHRLLERAGRLGVTGVDDLLTLPSAAAHPQAGKLRLVAGLPRSPGVYLFRDGAGRVLYVGKAADLRCRVRSYFSGDERRKIGGLLRETEAIDHVICSNQLEAAVVEGRLIRRHEPRFNRQGKGWRSYPYLKLTLIERFPRLSIVRSAAGGDGCVYLGPLPSQKIARLVADAIESVVPLRRCNSRPPQEPKGVACAAAQLGVATCPCSGMTAEAEYAAIVEEARAALSGDPATVVDRLARRIERLSAAGRFEEAASARDRAAAFTRSLTRQHRLDALVASGRVVLQADNVRIVLDQGRLAGDGSLPLPPIEGPIPRDEVDELLVVAAWLDKNASSVRLLHCDGGLSLPVRQLPRFEPRRPDHGRRRAA